VTFILGSDTINVPLGQSITELLDHCRRFRSTPEVVVICAADWPATAAIASLERLETTDLVHGVGIGRASKIVRLVLLNIRPADSHPGGYIDSVSVSHQNVTLSGWGMLSLDDDRVVIDTNLPVKSSNLATYARPDVVSFAGDLRLANAGISVNLELDESLPLPDKIHLCVWTDDPEFGRNLLYISPQPGLCPADGR
jgi:hypothetical protein